MLRTSTSARLAERLCTRPLPCDYLGSTPRPRTNTFMEAYSNWLAETRLLIEGRNPNVGSSPTASTKAP